MLACAVVLFFTTTLVVVGQPAEREDEVCVVYKDLGELLYRQRLGSPALVAELAEEGASPAETSTESS